MTPIKRYTKRADGTRELTLTLDPFAFVLNSFAMGDVIASAAVIKYLTDTYYVTPESYRVVVKKQFRVFFPFVPDSNIIDFDKEGWGIPTTMPMGTLNKKNTGQIVRNTPKAMHLSHYASLAFCDRIVPLENLPYVPIPKVDVDHFGVDFSKAVILVTTYRDVTRMWYSKDILELAAWIKGRGLTPVFVGKTDMDLDLDKKHLIPKSHLPADVGEHGIDLRNKTSIPELATIMGQAVAVCGVDSGPIHLAFTTDVPVICGYPTVLPEYRIPVRSSDAFTAALKPTIDCANCESRWRTSYHSFEQCFFGHANCCKEFTADRYIEHLTTILS